jgi:hypothetical protein
MQERVTKGRNVMNKKKVMFGLAGFLLGAAMAIPAQANPNPNKKKNCPSGWDRVKVNKAVCEDEARRVDYHGNDDGVVCEKYKPGNLKYRDNDKGNDW